jgi:hypothetical protein
MFGVVFYILLVLLVSDRYCLGVAIFYNLQDLEEQDFEKQQGARGKFSLTMLILYSFSLYFR